MRPLLAGAIALLAGCGPPLEFHSPAAMTQEEMLARASHVFVGTIEWQVFETTAPFARVGPDGGPWRLLRREASVELVLRGVETRQRVDVFEIAGTGGASGSWNSTAEGERNLFLVRVEDGRYHVVRDGPGPRSVFPVPRGWHARVPACRELVQLGLDECWEAMTVCWVTGDTRAAWGADVAAERKRLEDRGAEYWWRARGDREARRLLTTVSNRGMRAEFCRMDAETYPDDGEHGCPAERPPPATRVTADGDVPVD